MVPLPHFNLPDMLARMSYKIFVDGQEGTTGLEISQRLAGRAELEILSIDSAKRKDPEERRKLINASDITFLCLPDVAARESASLVDNDHSCLIDASTAHRTNPDWTYGIPELDKMQRERIRQSRRIAVPGCHASGFVIPMAPLVKGGIVPADYPVSFCSLTGYSGGGKKLIQWYEEELAGDKSENAPRMYALGLAHKHLPEVSYHTGLSRSPVFSPILANIYKGMLVSIPLHVDMLKGVSHARDVHTFLEEHYRGEAFVRVQPFGGEGALEEGYLQSMACNDTNRLDLYVFGHETQVLLVSRLDNLGKGASGAAVQCMNIKLGLEEGRGLEIDQG